LIKVIKRGGALRWLGGTRVDVRPVDLTQIEASPQAEDLAYVDDDPVARAEREAEIIRGTARAEAQSILDEAREEGHRAGAADAARSASELISSLESAVEHVAAQRNALIDEVEPQMLKLCIEAVEKITRHEIRTDPHVVERVIKTCLRRVKDSSEVCVRVNSGELEQMKASRDELLAVADGISSIQIVDDRRVSPGGCVVESESGSLDARIETQLNRLQDKLMERFEHDRGETGPGPDEIQRDDQESGHDLR
jgi:flagellar assembly protein FliH